MFLISHPCGAEFAWLLCEMELNKGAGRQFSELRGQDAESGFVIVVSGLFSVFCLVSRCSIVKDSPCVAIDRGSNRVPEVFRDAYMSSPFSLCMLQ
jgi:hypothetical protein